VKVDRVCWPISVSGNYESRPAALIDALDKRAPLNALREFHGRAALPGRRSWGSLLTRSTSTDSSAVLSPLFLRSELHTATWIDLYDDWSLAPEMNHGVRGLARMGYRELRRVAPDALITVNTAYMRDMLSPLPAVVIPNGVDPLIASCPRAESAASRLVMIGNFFDGRTDWDLMAELVRSNPADQAVIYGVTDSVVARLARRGVTAGPQVLLRPRTPLPEILQSLGPTSVVAIPHRVWDYTMSQDLMKAYQAVAAGIRIILPAELAPPTIPLEYLYLLGPGADIGVVMSDALAGGQIDDVARREFAAANSWDIRASQIEELLS